jgi:hypothetical protein
MLVYIRLTLSNTVKLSRPSFLSNSDKNGVVLLTSGGLIFY